MHARRRADERGAPVATVSPRPRRLVPFCSEHSVALAGGPFFARLAAVHAAAHHRRTMDAAIGLKARTGRAILVAIGASGDAWHVLERSQMPLLPPGAFAPYHAAEGLAPTAAQVSIDHDIADAHRLAADGIRAASARLAAAGHVVRACGVLVGPGMPGWSTAEILAVHVRMHQAEGELFRDVLVAGARACGWAPVRLAEKSALDEAARALGATRSRLEARIAMLGKQAGAPWGKDQKEAAAVALAALPAA